MVGRLLSLVEIEFLDLCLTMRMDFIFGALLPWCGIGFIGGLFRQATYKKERRTPHPAQIWIDTAMGIFTIISFLRNGTWL